MNEIKKTWGPLAQWKDDLGFLSTLKRFWESQEAGHKWFGRKQQEAACFSKVYAVYNLMEQHCGLEYDWMDYE